MSFYLKPPWEHQKNAVDFSLSHKNMALFWEMGTGKTGATINILRMRYTEESRLMKTIIFGPLAVVNNWKREFKVFSKIPQSKIIVLSGTKKQLVKKLMSLREDDKGSLKKPAIIIANYEKLQSDEIFQLLREWGPEIVVADESHRLKNHKSKRAKRLTKLADHATHKYILTGTPILNTPMDIWNQYRILDGGQTFGKNFFVFRGKYFRDANAGFAGTQNYFPKWEPLEYKFKELHEKMYSKALRVLKKDCLDLPPLVKKTYEVELSADQKRMYNEMKKEFVTYVDDLENSETPKAVVAQLAITKALRLQQIVTGFVKTDEGDNISLSSEGKLVPRLKALEELLSELTPEHKVIVWCSFKQNYEDVRNLCHRLGINFSELHGEVPAKNKQKNQDKFTQEDSCRVMIANQASAGIGINLVEASYSIFFSRTFSLEHDGQAEARNYRGGSEMHKQVTRIDLISPGTIDEAVAKALSEKQNVADIILDLKDMI